VDRSGTDVGRSQPRVLIAKACFGREHLGDCSHCGLVLGSDAANIAGRHSQAGTASPEAKGMEMRLPNSTFLWPRLSQ
jgi:hypothetical protein